MAADPLSIAASVAGLLTLAGAVYTQLSLFIENVKDAPQAAQTILTEVSLTRMALGSLSDLIDNFASIQIGRRAILPLDYLVLTVSQAVVTFSDLEAFLSRWPAISRFEKSMMTRLRWARQQEKATKIVDKLLHSRVSLSLVLNVFKCATDFDAMRARDQLQISLDQLLQENRELRTGLQFLSARVHDRSTLISSRPASTIRDQPSRADSIRPDLTFRRSFESVLDQTRLYARVRTKPYDMSLDTDQSKSQLGSMFSKLTLDRVSIVSVVALPALSSFIVNSDWYKTPPVLQQQEETTAVQKGKAVGPTIVVLGEGGCGKSALVMRYCYDHYSTHSDPTIEDHHYKMIKVGEGEQNLHIVDTSGIDVYESIRKPTIESGDAFMILYSLTKTAEYSRVEFWVNEVRKIKGEDCLIVLVATFLDYVASREIGNAEVQALADQLNCKTYQCSARNGINTNDPFEYLARELQRQSTKSKEPKKRNGPKLLGWEDVSWPQSESTKRFGWVEGQRDGLRMRQTKFRDGDEITI